MKIVADENMPLVRELFSLYGEVVTLPGRNLCARDIQQADVLLVRSVTQVNRQLLEGSQVGFVGSATIGVDHVDTDYLRTNNIAFSAAPGCNANGVVDYVCAALCALNVDWVRLCNGQMTVGIIGCGNVGGRLQRRLKKLGATVRCYDPFLDIADNPDLTTLDEVLGCAVVCLHTPHTRSGPFATHHMLSAQQLEQLSQGAILINAGRGAAIDNRALEQLLQHRSDLSVVLDVWENEPDVGLPLLQQVTLATPHIAGYSVQGKCNGTTMVRDAFLRWRGEPPPQQEQSRALIPVAAESICEAVFQVYDIRQDDQRMRSQLPVVESASQFDRLR
ncbi:MAG: 4-phosphoerythronate dehydrogenase, partial [Porticoccaceae bacterium]|nr:4-phosphoerythronate dehydrogenase [Porticoccaceae bacterium]